MAVPSNNMGKNTYSITGEVNKEKIEPDAYRDTIQKRFPYWVANIPKITRNPDGVIREDYDSAVPGFHSSINVIPYAMNSTNETSVAWLRFRTSAGYDQSLQKSIGYYPEEADFQRKGVVVRDAYSGSGKAVLKHGPLAEEIIGTVTYDKNASLDFYRLDISPNANTFIFMCANHIAEDGNCPLGGPVLFQHLAELLESHQNYSVSQKITHDVHSTTVKGMAFDNKTLIDGKPVYTAILDCASRILGVSFPKRMFEACSAIANIQLDPELKPAVPSARISVATSTVTTTPTTSTVAMPVGSTIAPTPLMLSSTGQSAATATTSTAASVEPSSVGTNSASATLSQPTIAPIAAPTITNSATAAL